VELGWAELAAAASSAQRTISDLDGVSRPGPDGRPGREGNPLVVAVDNSPECAATLLGAAIAGVDFLLAESGSSMLSDHSLVGRARPRVLVGPVSSLTRHCTYHELITAGRRCGSARPVSSVAHQFTSGSTGEPRIARVPLRAVTTGAELYRTRFGLTAADTVLAAVPLAHSFGFIGGLAAAVMSGSRLMTHTTFSVKGLLEGLAGGATVLLATPFVYALIASLPVPPGRLRLALSSGSPLSDQLAGAAAARLGCPVLPVYGSTETGVIAAGQAGAKRGAAVTFVPGVSWRLEPPSPELGAPPGSGHLFVRTPTMFTGYLGPQTPAFGPDGFYDTGDLVRVHDSGNLSVVARKSSFINVGGRKVNPARLERIIAGVPGVTDIAVVGTPAGDFGEYIHAVAAAASPVTASAILDFCRARLSPHEVPHHVHLMDVLPRTSMGKLDRLSLIRTVRDQQTGTEGGPRKGDMP
jgi:acyl-CoA synthetase (AMP-forming)/AMP-acid ligase II